MSYRLESSRFYPCQAEAADEGEDLEEDEQTDEGSMWSGYEDDISSSGSEDDDDYSEYIVCRKAEVMARTDRTRTVFGSSRRSMRSPCPAHDGPMTLLQVPPGALDAARAAGGARGGESSFDVTKVTALCCCFIYCCICLGLAIYYMTRPSETAPAAVVTPQ